MNTINELVIDGQRYKLLTPIPSRLKMPAASQVRAGLRENPTWSFFGGVISIVDPRTWTRVRSQVVPLGK
jgi:hypothetical protein